MKKNVLPTPGALSTPIVPPIISTSRLLMVRPRPVPPYLRVVEASAWLKALNRRPRCSGVMPMPVSRIENLISAVFSVRLTSSVETTISPCSVNLTELLARLIRTCPSRSGSPTSARGTLGAVLKSTSSPSFSWALTVTSVARFSMTLSRLKGIDSMASLPASIFEKSRMSLMMPSSEVAERWILVR